MKNIIRTVALVAVASFALVSCNKEAPSKAEVESGFAPLKSLPALTIGDDLTYAPKAGKLSVSVTISGLDTSLDSLVVGLLTSETEDFASSKFVAIENPADGTVVADGSVNPSTNYFVKAVAACTSGTVYSNVITASVPDVEWYYKLPRAYAGTVEDYWGDEYEVTITATFDEATGDVTFTTFDPYLLENNMNSITVGHADLTDLENPTVNFDVDVEEGVFNLSGDAIDRYGLVAVPMTDDFDDSPTYKITFNKEMTQMTVQAWGLYRLGAGWWEIYPTTTYDLVN